MKKNLLSIFGIAASFGAFAQLPVSTTPENKNVILEEFTGIYCGFCPAGHVIANGITASNPDDVVVINVHAGGFAAPNGADPDFRTPFGQALDNQSSLAGYPAGTVNRHEFPGLQQNTNNPGTAMGRGNWETAANEILTETSYVNVAVEGTVDFDTRVLTVDVEAYFTGTPPATMNLNVALMQNNIEGPQSGMAANPAAILPNGNYNHQHMLRHFLTGQWGEVITTGGQGSTYVGQFTYTLPGDINGIPVVIEDIEIAAYLAEGQQEIISGSKGPITFLNAPTVDDVELTTIDPSSPCDLELEPEILVTNLGGNNITSMKIMYNLGGQTFGLYNWTGIMYGYSNETMTLPSITVPLNVGTSLDVEIVEINGGADLNPSDNQKNVPIGTVSGTDFTFEFTQDRWGAELTWEILEESTGAVLYSGGPYTNLGPGATLLHPTSINLPDAGCYEVNISCSFGDGMGGEGKFELVAPNGDIVLSNTPNFTSEFESDFYVLSTTSLDIDNADAVEQLSVFPNPVTNIANIQFFLTDAENANLTIHNMLGKVVYTNTKLDQGQNIINFDVNELGAGMYFTTIQTENGSSSAKFTVAK